MKISVLLVEDAKQIMLTPENDHEKQALKMIAPEDKIEAVVKWGTFMDKEPSHYGFNVAMSQGGVYRAYADSDSLMFIVSKKEPEDITVGRTKVGKSKQRVSKNESINRK